MSESETQTAGAWLSNEDLDSARDRLPMLYVHAVPVRVDDRGVVTHLGLLLRADAEGSIGHEVVGGRVLYHERIRDAIARHLENDLGAVALPRLPIALQPFTVAEFFPTPGVTPFHDPRQHAVSLAYVVPVVGDCRPQQDALGLSWVTPVEADELAASGQMSSGHGVLVRQALAHLGHAV